MPGSPGAWGLGVGGRTGLEEPAPTLPATSHLQTVEVSSIDEGLGCVTEEVSIHHRHEREAEDTFLRQHVPLVVYEVLSGPCPQAGNQLCVIATSTPWGTAYEAGQQCGPAAGLSHAHRGPGAIGRTALQHSPVEEAPAGRGQQVHAHRGSTGTFPKQSH